MYKCDSWIGLLITPFQYANSINVLESKGYKKVCRAGLQCVISLGLQIWPLIIQFYSIQFRSCHCRMMSINIAILPTIFILGSALSATTKQHGVLFTANNKVKIKTSTSL